MSNNSFAVLPNNIIIPEYAREYKREYQFIKGIDKLIEYLREDSFNEEYYQDKIVYLIKKFLTNQEKGRFKELNKFYFWDSDISAILDLETEIFLNNPNNFDMDFINYFNKFYEKINHKYYDSKFKKMFYFK